MAKVIAYRALAAVYVDGVLHKEGETFVTDEPKGEQWEPVNPVQKAAAEASSEGEHGDVNLEALSVSELKAYAASLGVNLGEAKTAKDIITVIKAADDPTR